jgi:hypothetical protein
MGSRLIVRRDAGVVRRREVKTIAMVMAAVVGPCLLMVFLIAADMRMDLSELEPRTTDTCSPCAQIPTPNRSGGEAATPLIGWPRLREGRLPQGRVRMAGYMMDGYRPVPDGTAVTMFILMPEAGQLFHPAHRAPDEMVEVWMPPGRTIGYRDRGLVSVEGLLRRTAAFSMMDARVAPAEERDIAKWFALRR